MPGRAEADAAIERVRALGAEVDARDDGAVIRDPSGNHLYVRFEDR
jgi:hypothetical protein